MLTKHLQVFLSCLTDEVILKGFFPLAGGWTLVNVVWQRKAWVDQVVNKLWTENILSPYLQAEHADEETLLFCDNLACQVMPEFQQLLDEVGCIRFAGPKGATHLWQPVDQNIGAFYHRYMMDRYDDWMASGAAKKYGEAYGQTLSVEVRRELLMQWCGECYDELERRREALQQQGKEEESIFYRAFLNTGLLVTADDSDDDKIKVMEKLRKEGAPDAKIESVEQARQRQGGDFVVYLSDDDEDSDFDDGAGTDEDVDDDDEKRPEEEDDADEELVALAEIEAEHLIQGAVEQADIVQRLRDTAMRDDFLAEVDVGQEANSGRADSKNFEAEFKKLRLEYLEQGEAFPRFGTTAYDNLVNSLRVKLTPATRSNRSNRYHFSGNLDS